MPTRIFKFLFFVINFDLIKANSIFTSFIKFSQDY
jgi:hypothetical protein